MKNNIDIENIINILEFLLFKEYQRYVRKKEKQVTCLIMTYPEWLRDNNLRSFRND